MNIFFDFDDVLFHTKLFGAAYKDVFFRNGVSADCYDDAYARSRELSETPNYNFDRHLEIVQEECPVDEKRLMKDLDAFLYDTQKFVFADVVATLAHLRSEGYKLFLVSYGAPRTWQERKVAPSGIVEYFEGLAIGPIDKGVEVQKLIAAYPSEKNYFIDDRAEHLDRVKAVVPEMMTILMKRPEGRYDDDPSDASTVVAHDMEGVCAILAKA